MSFDLARKHYRQLRNKVPEKNIHYGHFKNPIDNPSPKTTRDIAEHQLYTIDKTIIELKRPKENTSTDWEDSSEEDDTPPCLGGYKDFGYQDAVFKESKFHAKSDARDRDDFYRSHHRRFGCGCTRSPMHHHWNHNY